MKASIVKWAIITALVSIGPLPTPALAKLEIGGNSGGGGNLNPSKLADAQTIDSFVRGELSPLLKMYFNYGFDPAVDKKPRRFAGVRYSDSKLDGYSIAVAEKLYGQSSTVFDKLGEVTIVAQTDACTDPKTGEPKDGSAMGNTVCLSTGRLANRYTINEYQKSVLALAAHELSHLLGTSEEEAEFLEAATLSTVKLDSWTTNHLSSRLFDVRNELESALERIENATRAYNNSPTALCLRLQKIRPAIAALKESTFSFEQAFGLSLMGSGQNAQIWVAALKAANLTAFCRSTPIGEEFEAIDVMDLFKATETSIDIAEYRSRLKYIPNHGEQGIIRKVSSGDKTALAKELEETKAAITEALSIVRK